MSNAFIAHTFHGHRKDAAGFEATEAFQGADLLSGKHPVWCARRFGQSLTFLPDGRIIQIAGEHEDFYDPDFCIYNDVFVHYPNGNIEVLGYPETVFPPTDFHTTSLLHGRHIWIIGSLGYPEARRYGETSVYCLDTTSMRIEKTGNGPGWIYKHKATVSAVDEIRISEGKIVTLSEKDEVHDENRRIFVLNTKQRKWSVQ